MNYTLNKVEDTAVSTDTYLITDMKSCPTGVKVQLMNPGGVLVYGNYDGKSKEWLAWAPLPRMRKES